MTATGPNVEPSTLEFAPRLTVIYGASETGKSYVVEALDYMFGGKAIRDIPQAEPYTTLLLGLELNEGLVVTLARELRNGNRVSVFEEDLRSHPQGVPSQTLLWQHKKGNPNTVSHFLLNELGIAGSMLRKNGINDVVSMSIRNLMHLCLIDENRIHTKSSPIHSGLPQSRTTESSAFKLLVEGEDDSAITTGEDPRKFRQVNRGQLAVLDRALESVRDRLANGADRPQLTAQLARINATIDSASASVTELVSERDALIEWRRGAQHQEDALREELREIRLIDARFHLLEEQYAADLARLAMIEEAGGLLGYIDLGECPFCGAQPQAQTSHHAEHEATAIAESVRSESQKTEALRIDLRRTLADMARDEDRTNSRIAETVGVKDDLSRSIGGLDSRIQPARADLAELLTKRSELEREVGLWDQISDLESLRGSVSQETPEAASGASQAISKSVVMEFSNTLNRVLQTWQVPGASDSHFEMGKNPDVYIEGRLRADRGKGIRSILHAGFAVGLSEFCAERTLPHPGFVVLDTPVLTYRDSEETPDRDEFLSQSVADAFYEYLSEHHSGQVVVLENQTPPDLPGEGCSVVYFTGSADIGRPGFYTASE
ncbi:hypothetical protein ITX31_01200 [Arthrobacter gandavensis]|uniref:ATP-binding protein n=1 Tax=Arthrobacter gandavensis TaxID=169960 RepID=UPI00188EC644|nr:ATP-binding protein [Arthrobacter gandavensis]MBF4992729.1 hypothetical protein [Arthrobacter gandavensis]